MHTMQAMTNLSEGIKGRLVLTRPRSSWVEYGLRSHYSQDERLSAHGVL